MLMHVDKYTSHPHQRSSSLQLIESITENSSQSQCDKQVIVGSPVRMATSATQQLRLSLGENGGEGRGEWIAR